MLMTGISREECNNIYDEVLTAGDPDALKRLCLEDLFFLITRGFKRMDVDCDWLFDRCREVEENPNGFLDLWSREHYKSTLITYALTIQDILNNPNLTVGIFSHTRPIAKAFLSQIKREFETNTFLQNLFPEVLYKNPKKSAPKWSLDDGIIVKRKSNPKEATVEAHGLVDGQPTSKHYSLMVYDDVVTRESVSTGDMIKKVTAAFELSLNLGAKGGAKRFIGTRYHANDTYKTIMDRGTATPRIYAATDDGTFKGKPIFLSIAEFAEKVRDMGSYTASCNCAGTKILMSDWTYKNIEDININDEVVGFKIGNGKKKTRFKLVKTKVQAIGSRIAEANRYILDSGDYVECTEDHKWWTGRSGSDTHKIYSNLGKQTYHDLKSLERISYIENELIGKEKEAICYLAGIIDGEGTISGKRLSISQSHIHNPEVTAKIQETLNILNIPHTQATLKSKANSLDATVWCFNKGKRIRHKLIQQVDLAKKHQVVSTLFGGLGKYSAQSEKIIKVEGLGKRQVYSFQTDTGNYIANGFASKNCQLLQNPLADNAMGFNREWLMQYSILREYSQWNFYLLVDPAGEKKKDNDYTVMVVIGLAPDNNYYLVDGIRDRMNLTERTNCLFRLHRKWKPKSVGYEKYGMQSDIEHIKYIQDNVENYRFHITQLGGLMPKNDRIRKLVPVFENFRFFIPFAMPFKTVDDKIVDFVKVFLDEEYDTFPVSAHDDIFDCIARIVDPTLAAVFPKVDGSIMNTLPIDTKEFDVLSTAIANNSQQEYNPLAV